VASVGHQPLHEAAIAGHQQVVEYLLEQRAILDVHDSQGRTALFGAAEHGHSDLASGFWTTVYLLTRQMIMNKRHCMLLPVVGTARPARY